MRCTLTSAYISDHSYGPLWRQIGNSIEQGYNGVCNGGQFMKRIPNEGPERYGLQYELHNSNIGAHVLYFCTVNTQVDFFYIKTCSYVVFLNCIRTSVHCTIGFFFTNIFKCSILKHNKISAL